jgi:hypothetical protein
MAKNFFYKVVERDKRHCSNWTIFKWDLVDYIGSDGTLHFKSPFTENRYNRGLEFKLKYLEYFPDYHKGSIVKAAPGSIGILVFNYLREARAFQKRYPALRQHGVIIKVIGEGLIENKRDNLPRVRRGCGAIPENIKRGKNIVDAPMGTLGYRQVRVIN